MALQEELAASQLLQGLQNTNPRMYDLFNILIKNIADTRIQTGIDVPRTLPKTTTGGQPSNVTPEEEAFFNILVATTLRI